jgi:hypothetical protein
MLPENAVERVSPHVYVIRGVPRVGLGADEDAVEWRHSHACGHPAALKSQGLTAAQAGKRIAAEFAGRYTGWQTLGNLPQSVQHAYTQP